MELKKLYRDMVMLCKREVQQQDFLMWCDIGARSLLAKYPKRILLPHGEYISPSTINDTLMLDGEFYTAIVYFIAGSILGNENYISKGVSAANDAYLKLWREKAKGKRIKGDRW